MPALRALPQCRGRVVRALAVDPDGLGTLLPRYLAPTRLPPPFGAAAQEVRHAKAPALSTHARTL